MELRDYLRILRRRWLLIATLTLLVIGAAAAWTFTSTPQYQSTARVFVSTSAGDSGETAGAAYQGGLFSQQRVTSYADLVGKSRELAEWVIDDLDVDLTAGELLNEVETTVVPETVIIDLSVTDPSPSMAQALAQSYATALSDLVRRLDVLRTPTTLILDAAGREGPLDRLRAVGEEEPPLRSLGTAAQPTQLLDARVARGQRGLRHGVTQAETLGALTSSGRAALAVSTSALNAAMSLTARSARILRSTSTPARFRPWMKRL